MIFEPINATVIRICILIAMLYLGNKWQAGSYNKQIRKIKGFKRRYGIVTVILIIVWWLLTPSGSPDDFITLYFIGTFGMAWYLISAVLLTLYIFWRLRISITIYES